jgi:hypothetical protein
MVAYLLTVECAVQMLRRPASTRIRFLTCVVGLLPLCHSVLLLWDYGVAAVTVIGRAAELVELFVSALCLTAIHLLNKENRDRNVTEAKLRLVDAAVPPPHSRVNAEEVPSPMWLRGSV